MDRHKSRLSSIFYCIVGTGLLYFPTTHAGSYKYEFSGVFGDCDLACQEAGLGVLEDTSFFGEVVIPSDVSNATTAEHIFADIPTESVRSYYTFPLEEAYMKFQTDIEAFNFDGSVPPTIMINNCIPSNNTCSNRYNLVWIFAQNESNFFGFYLDGFSPSVSPISSTAPPYMPIPLNMPSREQMEIAATYAYADIETRDNRAYIAPDWSNYPEPPMQVRFAYIPDETRIPTMPFSALGILVVMIYGVYFVEQSQT